ncbi:MAG: hypothetical protein ACTS73_00085 [Arsenophonus sp. NEOnobi-MAG3]
MPSLIPILGKGDRSIMAKTWCIFAASRKERHLDYAGVFNV